MSRRFALAAVAALGACAADPKAIEGPMTIEDVVAMHRRAIGHPRPIDRAIAAAEAEARCGGPVEMVVEGDPADHGASVSDYQCVAPAPERP